MAGTTAVTKFSSKRPVIVPLPALSLTLFVVTLGILVLRGVSVVGEAIALIVVKAVEKALAMKKNADHILLYHVQVDVHSSSQSGE